MNLKVLELKKNFTSDDKITKKVLVNYFGYSLAAEID